MSADGTARGGTAEPAGGDNTMLAKRLLVLIETVPRSEGGTLYSKPEVAEKVGISKQHLYKILKAETTPSWTLVQAIADLYGVGLQYFEDSEAGRRYAEQMEVLGALGLSQVDAVEFRGRPLSPKSSKLLANFARQLAEFEHGDDSGESGRAASDDDDVRS